MERRYVVELDGTGSGHQPRRRRGHGLIAFLNGESVAAEGGSRPRVRTEDVQVRGGSEAPAGTIVAVHLAPGIMVTGNVRLSRPLGEGAMGSVWIADHLTLHTEVAVKFISPELAADDQELLGRFTQEASLTAQVRNPHVVQIFDQGVMEDGTPYMVMELLEGESLNRWLDRRTRLSIHEASTVLVHVARALRGAHERGIVHRDVKPDNIFVTQSEDGLFCRVLDFGIAKQTRLPKMGLTHAGVMVGTPEYMSPEQVLSAKDVDFRADLWAMAVTNYLMLTGRLPYEAEALGTLCVKLLDGSFTPPSELRADLPPGVDDWFHTALAQEPTDRFGSARELAMSFVRLIARHDGIAENQLTFTGVLPTKAPGELGPRNELASSEVDTTAPRAPALPPEPTPPAVSAGARVPPVLGPPERTPTADAPLGGSSTRARGEPKRPTRAYVAGGIAIATLATAIVVLVRTAPEKEPATTLDRTSPEERERSEVDALPGSTADAPTEDETPSAEAEEGQGTASEKSEANGADGVDDAERAAQHPRRRTPPATKVTPPVTKAPPSSPPPPSPGTRRYDHGF